MRIRLTPFPGLPDRVPVYRILFLLSLLLAVISLLLSVSTTGSLQTVALVLCGTFFSLTVSTFIQGLASVEQDEVLRAITLRVPGITRLPEDFQRLRWIGYATQVADSENPKTSVFRFSPLTKVRSVGRNIVEYELEATNPSGRTVLYACTFIGLQNCVLGIIAKPGERSSVVVIDAPIPDVDYYFGAGYVTSWGGKRIASFQVVGRSSVPAAFSEFPPKEQTRFEDWYREVSWNIRDAHSAFTGRDA